MCDKYTKPRNSITDDNNVAPAGRRLVSEKERLDTLKELDQAR